MADSKASVPKVIDPHEPRPVDAQYATKAVWLVKVPKYLADKMKAADGHVGKIKTHFPGDGGKAEVLFCLNESQQNPGETTPITHKFITSAGFSQNLTVLSETETGKVVLEGKVQQRMECKPHADAKYMEFKKRQVEECNKPKREIQRMEKPVNTYKPVANHKHLLEHEQRKKAEGKRSRGDADHVKELLFKAFEKHQYYTLRDLDKLCQQPIGFLKDILKEICKYNMKAPHKNMYELKPEYRHYGTSSS